LTEEATHVTRRDSHGIERLFSLFYAAIRACYISVSSAW
jgi:hypothetical protein